MVAAWRPTLTRCVILGFISSYHPKINLHLKKGDQEMWVAVLAAISSTGPLTLLWLIAPQIRYGERSGQFAGQSRDHSHYTVTRAGIGTLSSVDRVQLLLEKEISMQTAGMTLGLIRFSGPTLVNDLPLQINTLETSYWTLRNLNFILPHPSSNIQNTVLEIQRNISIVRSV